MFYLTPFILIFNWKITKGYSFDDKEKEVVEVLKKHELRNSQKIDHFKKGIFGKSRKIKEFSGILMSILPVFLLPYE